MKAEHRHKLETNVLADRMGRFVQGVRENPRATSIAAWIIAVLAVVTSLAWYLTSGTSRSRSGLWVRLDKASFVQDPPSADELGLIAQESPGTIPGRTARFQRARLLLPQGLQMFATEHRKDAVQDIVEARKLYEQLATECGDDPLLRQEALLGAAKAEEALFGVPNDGKPGESYGSLDKAVELYNRAATADADSFLGKQASEHAQHLEQNRSAVEKFYNELNKLASSANTKP